MPLSKGQKITGRSKSRRAYKTDIKRPGRSVYLRERWKDPEYRAHMTASNKRNAEKAKAVGNRKGVPDGMRKADAQSAWAEAERQSERFIQIMEDAGAFDDPQVPDAEADMAKDVLKDAYKMAVSPMTDAKVKASYQRLVLDFTKAKPESKTKLTLDKSEEWLSELEKDMPKKHDGSTSDTPPTS